jgi:RNA polymerase sigma factor (sigma-70 family)
VTSDVEWGFEAFFRDQYPVLWRAMVLLTGDRADAEDLAQEAMARVYERWERVEAMSSPGGYLYRVALNLHRKRRRRRFVLPPVGPEPAGDPAQLVETESEVLRLLELLPAGQRQALVLVEWLGLESSDAAPVLGISPTAVRVRVHRAKAALRDQVTVDE